jgi:aspartate/methionine/tyrosine aminotransferase
VGANHLRISYANSRERIAAALERMRSVFEPVRV